MSVESILEKENYGILDLVEIMNILRGENGCPWDIEQTNKSIRNNLIEECYELIEGIDKDDDEMMKEELGDVLLQVIFHAKIADDEGRFNLDGVCDRICKKLILRHPHIFSDTKVKDSAQVLDNWDEIKKKEKSQKSATDTLRSVSPALPALVRASKLASKAAKSGFTFDNAGEAVGKVNEELSELCEAIEKGNSENISEETGDLLFAVVNLSRMCGVNAEEALYRANEKFVDRFSKMEKYANDNDMQISRISKNEKLEIWTKNK